ncbi:hypothetical protein EHQ12_12265 [Leptospira gomenensis]|uniref:Lipoprotein n=1 Tax=Leptospira gomenensis TaxID=2484974 RepID=A0A5F1YP46_9LEPT|nr:hypothetical protein [Leptospira gomenensis]TGK32708.1 hypothetical protein EHQ17_12110 [Leptospira gomenensis]TGK36855.1 hypothetical protein EHQ12_12265 [Leptospira gomenensis]TGK39931.1 hypothetical protein EHQ07_19565 [Leptospira gomenensis]TGK58066.1 hypothetical protein EHQ13_14465 [Leptospira gomenensis]
MKLKSRLLWIICVSLLFGCAAFVNSPETREKSGSIPPKGKFRIEFTGFEYYKNEMQLLRIGLWKKGYEEDPRSDSVLEIVLEELQPEYAYPMIHRLNFFLTLFTLGIAPYHVRSDHRIVYRFFTENGILHESIYDLSLDQWRGWLTIPIMPVFWPSSSFEKSVLHSLDLLEENR